jgi:hypothetical protein
MRELLQRKDIHSDEMSNDYDWPANLKAYEVSKEHTLPERTLKMSSQKCTGIIFM